MTTTVKPKKTKRIAIPITLDEVQCRKLDALVSMDKTDRNKVIRKALDYAFDNPQAALSPKIG